MAPTTCGDGGGGGGAICDSTSPIISTTTPSDDVSSTKDSTDLNLATPIINVEESFFLFFGIPIELMLHIFTFLSLRDLGVLSLVCRGWHHFCSMDAALWRKLLVQYNLWRPDVHERLLSTSNNNDNDTASTVTDSSSTVTEPNIDWRSVFKKAYVVERNWRKRTNPLPWKVLTEHTGVINCLQFDQKIIASGSDDFTIKIWNRETGKEIKTLMSHKDYVASLQFKQNTLISGSGDKSIKIWDIEKGRCLDTLHGHMGIVYCLRYDQPRHRIISGSLDKTVKIWDASTSQCLDTLIGHEHYVNDLIQYDRNTVITASEDKTIKLWDLNSGRCLFTLRQHAGAIRCLDFHENTFVSGSEDKKIKIWDLRKLHDDTSDSSATAAVLNTLVGHQGGVWCIQMGSNNKIVSGSGDRKIKIWDGNVKCRREGDSCLNTISTGGAPYCLQFDADTLMCGLWDEVVKIYRFDL
eukprot:GEZU01006942.1.p1 GENE.GEZU01006942.1~~GEZU01006942.1.p1  ORF type:complete len:480 (+),score=104.19 GEZU01006942.1:44-1441(+)